MTLEREGGPEPQAAPAGWRRPGLIGRAVRIAFGLSLIVAALVFINPRRLAESADGSLIVAALAMQPIVVIGWFFAGWRHTVLVGRPHPPIRLGIMAYVTGVGINVLVPLRAGEIVKATYLREHFGTPVAAGIAAVVLSRLLDAAVVGAIGIAGLSALISGDTLRPILVTLGGGLAAMLLIAMLPRARLRLLARRSPRWVAVVLRFLAGIARVARSGLILRGALLSCAGWSANFAAVLVFLSVQTVVGPLSLAEMAALYAVTLFAGAMPGLPGGFGAYQAAGAFFLVQRGYPLEASLVLLVMMQIGVLTGTVLFAGVALTRRSSGVAGTLRRMRESVRAS